MQKITGLVPVVILRLILEKKIKSSGLLLMEEIGKEKRLFQRVLKELKKEAITIRARYR